MLKKNIFITFCIAFLLCLFWDISAGISNFLMHFLFNHPSELSSQILFSITLPRILLALLTGAILSGSGCIMQNVFHNPLIDPYLLGISSGAALGCAISMGFLGGHLLFLCAFLGALFAVICIIFFAQILNNSVLFLVLIGVIFSAFLGAIAGLIKFFVPPDVAQAIVIWLLGSLSLAQYSDVWLLCSVSAVGFFILFLLRFRINLLALSDVESISLGINPNKLRILCLILISIMCSASVSVSGTIGWIGLIVPHFARLVVGSNLLRLLPTSILFGAMLLYIMDFASKTIASTDLPVGSVCAIVGAPLFLVFLLTKRKNNGF